MYIIQVKLLYDERFYIYILITPFSMHNMENSKGQNPQIRKQLEKNSNKRNPFSQ